MLADRVKEDNLPITSLLPMCSDLIRLKIVAEDGTEQIVSEGDKGVTVVRTGNRVNISVNSFGPVLEYLRILTDSSGNSNNSEDIKVKDLTLVNDHTSVSIYLLTERLISVINEESIPDSVVKITETHIAGWDELVTNIHNDDENVVLSSPVDIDNLNLRIVTSAGEEDLITNDSKGLTINKKSDGSYVLVFISGVNTGTSVYEFRLKGNIDGSGDTIIPYVDMVTPSATLSVYQWNKSHEVIRSIDDTIIPDSIARKGDIPKIPEIIHPVTSVNGQTGDVVISEGVKSWNDLLDKPFGEDYKLLFSHTPENMNCYHGNEVFKSGIDYRVVWKGSEYIGRTVDRNGYDTYIGQSSSLFLYDKSGKYVIGNLWCYYNEAYKVVECTNYLKGYETDSLYVYDPTCVEVRTLDDTFISENIARKSDLTWSSLGERQTVLIPRGKNAYVTGCPAPIPGVKYTYTVYGEDGRSWSFTNTWWYDDSGLTWDQGEPAAYFFFSDGNGVIGWFPELGAYITSQDYYHGNDEYEICQAEPTIQPVDEKYLPESVAFKHELVRSWDDLPNRPFYHIPGEESILQQDGKFVAEPHVGKTVRYINSSTGEEYTGVWQDVSEFD